MMGGTALKTPLATRFLRDARCSEQTSPPPWTADVELSSNPDCGQRREIIGVVIHVVTVARLCRAAMAAAIVGDDAKPLLTKNSICASQSSDDRGHPMENTIG